MFKGVTGRNFQILKFGLLRLNLTKQTAQILMKCRILRQWEPDKKSRDKTSHAIFLHPGQNIPQRFATPDKTSHAVFVTPDITSHAIFVTLDITSHAIFATPDKTSHTQIASSG